MCRTQIYFYETCKCRRGAIHLCDDTQDHTPCPNLRPSLQEVRHDDLRCLYHEHLYQNPNEVSDPASVGRIISSSGRINKSADAEKREQNQCQGCDTTKCNTISGCQTCSNVVVWYFSPMEECAGRVTIGKDGVERRYATDGIDRAVKKVPLSTICPRPPPPMSKSTGA